tara:strand:+ start:48005 stop:48526 length:522 start_codon:yes stop_codon:yes gene_type:complete
MSTSRSALFARLDALEIRHQTVEHPPIFTVDEGREHKADMPGAHTKNLFLKDRLGQSILITARDETVIRLNRLHRQIGSGRLSFGPEPLLFDCLGVRPGSVTALALINDTEQQVRFLLDKALLDWPLVWCHPLSNDATTGLSPADLLRFIDSTGHTPEVIDFAALLEDEEASG